MRARWRPETDGGSSTVELVIVLPVLLLVLFGVMEVSRAWMTAGLVTAAAREAARTGAVTPTASPGVFDPGPALARLNQVLAGGNLTATTATVTCTNPCVNGSLVTATVVVPFTTPVPLLQTAFSGLSNIQGTATMRFE